MYIDTHTRKSMGESVCKYLCVTQNDINRLFDMASKKAQTGMCFDGGIFDEIINKFIFSKISRDCSINQILFFHLGRRLNDAKESCVGNNLFDLLSTTNVMSDFLKQHEVEFFPCDGYLDLYYRGKIISLEDTMKEDVPYLRWRLGHNKDRIDYCFNGFMLKDMLCRNNYSRELFGTPEFIGVLGRFLKRNDFLNDYLQQSTFYCFEYQVPLDRVFFDDKQELSNSQKPVYLINRVLNRLFEYYSTDEKYIFDHDNPMLRLKDDDTMSEKFFVSRKEITLNMLR